MAGEHKPTQKMAAAARRGLKLRDKFDRGGTDVGVRRARQIVEGGPMSDADVKSMHSYFARHAVDKDNAGDGWNTDKDPSAGFIAWLLWGGDDGKRWADMKRKKLDD